MCNLCLSKRGAKRGSLTRAGGFLCPSFFDMLARNCVRFSTALSSVSSRANYQMGVGGANLPKPD